MQTMADDELDDGPEVDLTRGTQGGGRSGTDHPFPPTPGARDESRTERGLASPVMRGPRDSEGQSRDRVS